MRKYREWSILGTGAQPTINALKWITLLVVIVTAFVCREQLKEFVDSLRTSIRPVLKGKE